MPLFPFPPMFAWSPSGPPIVEATNQSQHSSGVTSHTVSLPAGIQVGETLVVFFAYRGGGTTTDPSGWTSNNAFINSTPSPTVRTRVLTRVADGTEGASITVTTGVAAVSAHQSFRISGALNGLSGVESDEFTANSSAPDAPNLTPSWGEANNLWFASVANISTSGAATPPTNYANAIDEDTGGGSSGIQLQTSRRTLKATSEDPGTWSYTNAQEYIAFTVAVRGG